MVESNTSIRTPPSRSVPSSAAGTEKKSQVKPPTEEEKEVNKVLTKSM